MRRNHPALARLHLRSTEKEVTTAMRKGGYQPWDYAKDREFGEYALTDVVTYAQARALLIMLNADRWAMEGNKQWNCQKTGSLKDSLDYWKRSKFLRETCPSGEFIASARRVHCICHEVGSFALSARQKEGCAKVQAEKKKAYNAKKKR